MSSRVQGGAVSGSPGHRVSTSSGRPEFGSLGPPAPGPFSRSSTIRLVVGEPIMSLVYQRALVMEVAHSKVGAAVAEHSSFRERPIRRLWATFDAAMRLVFGDGMVPRQAAEQIYRFHDHVNGPMPGGDGYTAHDASLLVWVWATLVDTCDVAFTRWVRPFRPGEAEAFYADMRAFARFFGIPEPLIPPSRGDFARYLDDMLNGDDLGATEASRAMTSDILWFDRWWTPSPLTRSLRVLAVGTLDSRLARRLGLGLSRADRRLFDRLDGSLVRGYRHLPAWRTRFPYGYLALRGLGGAPGVQGQARA